MLKYNNIIKTKIWICKSQYYIPIISFQGAWSEVDGVEAVEVVSNKALLLEVSLFTCEWSLFRRSCKYWLILNTDINLAAKHLSKPSKKNSICHWTNTNLKKKKKTSNNMINYIEKEQLNQKIYNDDIWKPYQR